MIVIPSANSCLNSYRLQWPVVASAVISRGKAASNDSATPRRCLPQGRSKQSSKHMHDCIAEQRIHFYCIATTTQWHSLVGSCYHVAAQSTHLFLCLILPLFHATANISTRKLALRFRVDRRDLEPSSEPLHLLHALHAVRSP